MTGRTQLLTGRIISGLVVIFLLFDAGTGLLAPQMLAAENAHAGFQSWHLTPIGAIALVCALVYAFPRTALLGAILVTGFAGGAICTHFRLGEIGSPPQLICLALGIAAWGGLWLRDARLRALLPFSS